MARPSSAAHRTLTLTEELEKLEQSITLTLQEIDHNFSRAHRIVTSSILPVVEQYAAHSRDVWEGSRFWKQFFEASANVSLNGYEEAPEDGSDVGTNDEDHTLTATTEDELLSESAATPASRTGVDDDDDGRNYRTTPGRGVGYQSGSDETATPRAAQAMGSYASPYEALRRQHRPGPPRSPSPSQSMTPPTGTLPSTPRAQTYGSHLEGYGGEEGDTSTMDADSPDLPTMPAPGTSSRRTPGKGNGVLLHRVLDRNYRVQMTPMTRGGAQRLPGPHSTARRAPPAANKLETPARTTALAFDLDSSPMEAAPTAHANLLDSPARTRLSAKKADWTAQRSQGRVPGVSVLQQTPGRRRSGVGGGGGGDDGGMVTGGAGAGAGWDSDSDEDIFEGMSPPKTMQFHVPTSRLMKTPAREASRRIVEDLMHTAGLQEDEGTEEVDSPSIVRKDYNVEDDTF